MMKYLLICLSLCIGSAAFADAPKHPVKAAVKAVEKAAVKVVVAPVKAVKAVKHKVVGKLARHGKCHKHHAKCGKCHKHAKHGKCHKHAKHHKHHAKCGKCRTANRGHVLPLFRHRVPKGPQGQPHKAPPQK